MWLCGQTACRHFAVVAVAAAAGPAAAVGESAGSKGSSRDFTNMAVNGLHDTIGVFHRRFHRNVVSTKNGEVQQKLSTEVIAMRLNPLLHLIGHIVNVVSGMKILNDSNS